MKRVEPGWPASTVPSLLAALTTWVALWSWAGFVESPSGFVMPVLGAVLLVAVTGALLRSTRRSAAVVVAGQLLVLTVWTSHLWAAPAALGGWLPTPAAVHDVIARVGAGVAAAQDYHAPVSDSVPQIFPLLVGAGALVGVLVDLLACGLRRVPLAGLPLLAVYTAPVSILPTGVPWWVFGLTALSFLALLATDEGQRLLSWGRRVPRGDTVRDTGAGAVSSESIRSSARRIGLTATGLALVAPVVIPTLDGGFLPGNGPGAGGAGGAVDISNPLVDLRRDLVRGRDENLVTVRTDAADPSYLRISVLDSFDGRTWQPSRRAIPPEHRADGLLPRPPGLRAGVPRTQVHYAVAVSRAFRSTWLPTPYPVTGIRVPGDWRYDSSTFDFVSAREGETAAGLDYSLTALQVTPRVEDLVGAASPPEAVYTPYTALPQNLPGQVRNLARRLTTGIDSRFEQAVRLQRWFREDGGFRYSLAPAPGNGNGDLLAFLSRRPGGRVGYCEQFAAAMAVMGRTVGIPSRVAVGFMHPDKVGRGEYVFSSHDLHAWPEMYFDGVGWVRFEPTPGDRAADVPGYTTAQASAPQPTQLPSASAPAAQRERAPQMRRQLDPGTASPSGRSGGEGAVPWVLVLLAACVLLLAPRGIRSGVRRRRWASAGSPSEAAEAGWRELRDTALDLQLTWDDSVTLRTTARALAGSFGRLPDDGRLVRGALTGARANPEAAHALERLVRDVERARYARASDGAGGRQAAEVATDVESCCEALRAGATAKRWRAAVWLPGSLVRNLRRPWAAPRRPASRAGVEVGMDRAS